MHVPQYGTLNDPGDVRVGGTMGLIPTNQDSGLGDRRGDGLRWRRCRPGRETPGS